MNSPTLVFDLEDNTLEVTPTGDGLTLSVSNGGGVVMITLSTEHWEDLRGFLDYGPSYFDSDDPDDRNLSNPHFKEN